MSAATPSLLDRFLRYVRLDTQSDETSSAVPSTEKQLELSRMLRDECEALGLEDVQLSDAGTVTATVPKTVDHAAPAIAWVAHVDTSPEFSSENIKPQVIENYGGGDIPLTGDASKIIKVAENPELETLKGATVITTDGTTLLGGDDKCGVAVIMETARHLMENRDIPVGPIRLCFTCDEEIGRGADHVDLELLNAACGYTLDGDGVAKIENETFSADQAKVTVTGINTHPSIGKGAMVNAIRILAEFIGRLPTTHDAPEVTDGREGFMHPYHIEGGVPEAEAWILLRDFELTGLNNYAAALGSIAADLRTKYPRARIQVDIKKQYRNMREGLLREPRAVAKAIEATKAAGLEPIETIIRGGTDGSILSERGLPTPNLSTGEHNPHSPLEWTSVEEMQSAVTVLVELAKLWGEEDENAIGV